MSYHVESCAGDRVASCPDLLDALAVAKVLIGSVEPYRVVADDGRILWVSRASMIDAADRHNEGIPTSVPRGRKRKPRTCSATGEPHQWAPHGADFACETCGALGVPWSVSRLDAGRMRTFRCRWCRSALATRRMASNGFRTYPACDACAERMRGAS